MDDEVCLVFRCVEYEGSDLFRIFRDPERAEEYKKELEKDYPDDTIEIQNWNIE